jgi:hypothetical protein
MVLEVTTNNENLRFQIKPDGWNHDPSPMKPTYDKIIQAVKSEATRLGLKLREENVYWTGPLRGLSTLNFIIPTSIVKSFVPIQKLLSTLGLSSNKINLVCRFILLMIDESLSDKTSQEPDYRPSETIPEDFYAQ